MKNPPIEIDATEMFPENKNKETSFAKTIFNEARQFVYVFRTREREILLIQQPI